MRNHLNPDAEGPREAQKASNHPQMPPHAIGPHGGEKTCLITALHRTFRDSMVSKHPPNPGLPAVKVRMAKSFARKGGTTKRRFLSNQADGGLSSYEKSQALLFFSSVFSSSFLCRDPLQCPPKCLEFAGVQLLLQPGIVLVLLQHVVGAH